MKHLIKSLFFTVLFSYCIPAFSQEPDSNPNISTIFTAVEHQPEFPGGNQAFGNFLRNNIAYPAEAKQKNIQGRVFVQFVVERDGSLTDIKILREPGGGGLDDEALRVLKLSPKWSPGTQNRRNVRVQYTIPVNFTLGTHTLASQASNPLHQDTTKGLIYNAVEVSPVFPGGQWHLGTFLSQNIQYPAFAKRNHVTGKAFVAFVVEKDGSLSNLHILRDPGAGLGDEAVRVLKLCPAWTPGIQNGKPVRVQCVVPINFSLD